MLVRIFRKNKTSHFHRSVSYEIAEILLIISDKKRTIFDST